MTTKNENKKPTIYIDAQCYAEIMAYTAMCPIEICGIANAVVIPGKNAFYVSDPTILPQTCSAGGAQVDDLAMANYMEELCEAGKEDELVLKRFSWHSHAGMGVMWSGIDEDHIQNDLSQYDWVVSLVTNHAGNMLGRVDIHTPINHTFYDCPVVIDYAVSSEREAEIAAEIKAKVKEQKAFVTKYSGFNRPGYDKKNPQVWDATKGCLVDNPNTTTEKDEDIEALNWATAMYGGYG